MGTLSYVSRAEVRLRFESLKRGRPFTGAPVRFNLEEVDALYFAVITRSVSRVSESDVWYVPERERAREMGKSLGFHVPECRRSAECAFLAW